jgi:7-cyano-7-deazaguanine synthase
MSKQKVLVVLSGGQDSTTCLYWALSNPDWDVYAITFDYKQRHRRELNAARRIAAIAGLMCKHEVVELGPILKGTSPLVSGAALEQYADSQSLPGGLEKTFVPMRNQLFLTVAANRAYCLGAHKLVTGVCEEDYGGYPDCRREFINHLEDACSAGTFTGEKDTLPALEIFTPLMNLTKAQTVGMALALKGCYQALAYSHTAYDGQYPPKGKDHATLLREKGFAEAGVPDPLILRACSEGLMELPVAPNYQGDLSKYWELAGLEPLRDVQV